MSGLGSPRDAPSPSGPGASAETPSSSGRPSLDAEAVSALLQPPGPRPPRPPPQRSNRAALRQYYQLPAAPRLDAPDSTVPLGELDGADFAPADYVAKLVADSSLQHLLRLYAQVVAETRALDAEKKALVYDNYSKLIAATETIRKMRASMDPLNPMASTLNPAIAHIYSQAASIRQTLRQSIPPPDSEQGRLNEAEACRQRTRDLAVEVVGTPQRLRELIADGRVDEARRQWEMPRRLLYAWKEKGLGGLDVQACIDEGNAALGIDS